MLAVEPDEQREGDHHLRLEPVGRHHVPAGQEVEALVGAADLDVGFNRDRVVGLHDRVQELGQRDGRVPGEALGEVVALEQAGDRHRPRQPHRLGKGERPEPLPVLPHLGLVAIEDPEGLVGEKGGVRVEHLVGEHRPLLRTPRWIADPSRVVAHDQHDHVPGALEVRQAVEDVGEPEVDIGRRRVDPELDAQRSAERELALELALGQDVDRMRDEIVRHSRARLPAHWRCFGQRRARGSGGASASSDFSPSS